MNRWLVAVASSVVPFLAGPGRAASAKATPLFIELPREALAVDVGAGGFVIGGTYYSGGAFHWMPTSSDTAIGGTGVSAVSRDGKTIVGRALDAAGFENAAIWTGGTSWRLLGSFTPNAQPCDLLLSASYGASDDGKVVVGLGWDGCRFARAFRWEESTGMVDLGSTVPDRSSRANNVSGDGRVVIGWQEDVTGVRMGARWIDRTQDLFSGPSGAVGEASRQSQAHSVPSIRTGVELRILENRSHADEGGGMDLLAPRASRASVGRRTPGTRGNSRVSEVGTRWPACRPPAKRRTGEGVRHPHPVLDPQDVRHHTGSIPSNRPGPASASPASTGAPPSGHADTASRPTRVNP